MIKENEMDAIKKLIQKGFDLELISFELDIPLEEIKEFQQEIEKQETNTKKYNYAEITNKRNEEIDKKIQQLRERYEKLYLKNSQKDNVERKELSEEEIAIINSSIATIQKIVKEMGEASKYKRRENAKSIIREVKKVQDYQLTIEQAEQLNGLLNVKELHAMRVNILDEMDSVIDRYRRKIDEKLVEAIDSAQSQTEDLEELKALGRKITTKMERENPLVVSAVKNKIYNKITKIKQNKALESIRKDIPSNISKIINDLVDGTIDVEKAREVIKEEAKRRLANKPKAKFSLTEEQQEKQILIQIGIAIREQADRFRVINPRLTIGKLQELCGEGLSQATKTVVENLIAVKEFEEAKSICNEFIKKDRESPYAKEMRDLKLRIRNAEISDFILKGINMQGTEEEERKYFELIEKGIKMGNVKLRSISLGKSQDGTRNITLADIWTDENEKSENIR